MGSLFVFAVLLVLATRELKKIEIPTRCGQPAIVGEAKIGLNASKFSNPDTPHFLAFGRPLVFVDEKKSFLLDRVAAFGRKAENAMVNTNYA